MGLPLLIPSRADAKYPGSATAPSAASRKKPPTAESLARSSRSAIRRARAPAVPSLLDLFSHRPPGSRPDLRALHRLRGSPPVARDSQSSSPADSPATTHTTPWDTLFSSISLATACDDLIAEDADPEEAERQRANLRSIFPPLAGVRRIGAGEDGEGEFNSWLSGSAAGDGRRGTGVRRVVLGGLGGLGGLTGVGLLGVGRREGERREAERREGEEGWRVEVGAPREVVVDVAEGGVWRERRLQQ